MSTTPAGVQQQIDGAAQGAVQVSRNISTEGTFDSLWEKGAFEPVKAKEPAKEKPQTVKEARNVQEPPPQDDAKDLRQENEAQLAAEEGEEEPVADERPTYNHLNDYLKDAGVEPESFLELPVTVKVDGQSQEVPLKEVIKSYQLEGHVNNKSIELSDKLRSFEAERNQVQQALAQQIQQTQTLYQMAEQQLIGDYARVDWVRLRAENPAEFAAASTEYQQKLSAIRGQLQQVTAQAQQAETERAKEAAKLLPQQREKMLDAVPEWRDSGKFEKDRSEILTYGKKLGFSDAELGNIHDYRFMKILHDATRYAALQASKPEAMKKVRAAPVMARPGSRTERDPKALALNQARERFQKNPRDQDSQAAYFEQFT